MACWTVFEERQALSTTFLSDAASSLSSFMAMDSAGVFAKATTSDPRCVLKLSKGSDESFTSATRWKSLNPVWLERFGFLCDDTAENVLRNECCLEVTGEPWTMDTDKGPVTVFPARINCNLKGQTMEEIEARRRTAVDICRREPIGRC